MTRLSWIVAAIVLAAGAWLATPALDLSAGRIFSLAPGTRQVLVAVDNHAIGIDIEVFYAKDQPGFATVADLVRRVDQHSAAVGSTFVDPDGTRAIELRVASGAVVANGPAGTFVVRTPDEADLAGVIARAAGLEPTQIRPNTAPTQPLTPTPLGRMLLWLLPSITAPIVVGALGAGVVIKRRRPAKS